MKSIPLSTASLIVIIVFSVPVRAGNPAHVTKRITRHSLPWAWGAPTTTTELLIFLRAGTDADVFGRENGLTIKHALRSDPDAYVFVASSAAAALRVRDGALRDARVRSSYLNERTRHVKLAFVPNDPYFHKDTPMAPWPGQWHLSNEHSPGLDVQVMGAWGRDFTGNGVIIGIVDDCLETQHPDLSQNYVAADSWDFGQNDADPNPVYGPPVDPDNDPPEDRHGVSVAGVAAARGNNGIGVTGAAPYAGLAGLRVDFWRGTITMFADATLYHSSGSNTNVKIKNHSYGTIAPYFPSTAEVDALVVSAGAGTIHVFAAGNERQDHGGFFDFDNDGFVTDDLDIAFDADTSKKDAQGSEHAITVAALGSNGVFSVYSSWGASVFVTAPSSDFPGFGITTTDRTTAGFGYNAAEDFFPDPDYTSVFGGTSSAAPLVAGVLALVKEAKPNLDTRFAKHLLVVTSDIVDAGDLSPSSDGGWKTNAAGNTFNQNYGFGLIDADELTQVTTEYCGVSELETESTGTINVHASIPDVSPAGVFKTFNLSATTPLEEVLVRLNITHTWRGDIEAAVTSPSGTTSRLMRGNPSDSFNTINWTFVSNAFWGEIPAGTWTLRIFDTAPNDIGTWNSFRVTAHMGTLMPACNVDDDCDQLDDECSENVCNQSTGCCQRVNANENSPCDDGLFCTANDTCQSGVCVGGDARECSDGIACTVDLACNEGDDLCESVPDDGTCDDGNACTEDLCDPDGIGAGVDGCVHSPHDTGTACNDAFFCNGDDDRCDGAGVCIRSGDPCTDRGLTCTEDDGGNCVCDSNEDCDDGLFCTGEETCSQQACRSLGNPCSGLTPVCDEDNERCVECVSDADCDDALFCNGVEVCDPASSECVEGEPLDCDDGVACTDDSCNEASDQCNHFAIDANCDDGVFCNGAESCDSELGCQAGSDPCPGWICCEETETCLPECCGDADCTDDEVYCNGAELCVDGTCVSSGDPCADRNLTCSETEDQCECDPDNDTCADGAYCNGMETCNASTLLCDAGVEPCSDAICCEDADVCAAECCGNADCPDDGNFCNGTEACTAGMCVSSGDPCSSGLECANACNETADDCNVIAGTQCTDDGNVCTTDACNGFGSCVATNNTLTCDDGDPCTMSDKCRAGSCGGTDVDCSDLHDDCNRGSCNATTGVCETRPAHERQACDDGLFCTEGELCKSGVCTGGRDRDCTLANHEQCYVGACDENAGLCVRQPADDGEPCNDGMFCTAGETCAGGVCLGGQKRCPAGEVCFEAQSECRPLVVSGPLQLSVSARGCYVAWMSGDPVAVEWSTGCDVEDLDFEPEVVAPSQACFVGPNVEAATCDITATLTRIGVSRSFTCQLGGGGQPQPVPPVVSRADGNADAVHGLATVQFIACADEEGNDQVGDGCTADVTVTAEWSSNCGGTIAQGEFIAPTFAQDTICTIQASVILDTGETLSGTFELTVLADDQNTTPPDSRACGACGALGVASWSLMLIGLLGLRVCSRGTRRTR